MLLLKKAEKKIKENEKNNEDTSIDALKKEVWFKAPKNAHDHVKLIHTLCELVRRGFIPFSYQIKAL